MTQAIILLRLDHENLSKLLTVLEGLAAEVADGASPDFELLSEIAEYLNGFPIQCHHPKEDLIYRRLIRIDPASTDRASDLAREHEKLEALTEQFASALDQARSNSGLSMDGLVSATAELVDYYRHHIDVEERYFFPKALNMLTSDDWAEVNFAVSERPDPLLDEATEKFRRLRSHIMQIAKSHGQAVEAPATPQQDAAALGDLETLDQFNAAMSRASLKLRLKQLRSGGYELRVGSITMLSIPDCAEKYAIWCAQGFVLGRDACDPSDLH